MRSRRPFPSLFPLLSLPAVGLALVAGLVVAACLALPVVPAVAAPKLSTVADRDLARKLEPTERARYLALFCEGQPGPTRLRAWNGQSGDMAGYVDQAPLVDWHREVVTWKFEWTSRVAGATRGAWQVSNRPLPRDLGDWRDPTSVIAAGEIAGAPAGGAARYFAIDFAAWVPNADGSPRATAAMPTLAERKGRFQALKSQPQPKPRRNEFGDLEKAPAVAPAPWTGPLFPAPLRVNLFVRVVPLDDRGEPAGPASEPVMLCFGEPDPAAPVNLFPEGLGHPSWAFTSYQPVRPDAPDCLCIYRCTRDVPLSNPQAGGSSAFGDVGSVAGAGMGGGQLAFRKGQLVDVCAPHDGDIIDDVLDGIGDFIDALAAFVDWAAGVYNGAKDAFLSVVVEALKGTTGCGTVCEAAVGAAFDAGLACLGLPPSVPDWDQLVDLGGDYLAAYVAAQAGVPEELVDQGIDAMVAAARDGGGAAAPVLIPDPDHRYRPLALTLTVSNTGGTTTRPVDLVVTDKGGRLYQPVTVPVPAMAPGASLKIPVFPCPVVDPHGWMGNLYQPEPGDEQDFGKLAQRIVDGQQEAQKALAGWTKAHTQGVVTFVVTTVDPATGTTFRRGELACDAGGTKCRVTD